MKRLVAILLVVLSVFSFTCCAEEIDLTSMTFEELIELRNKIDTRLKAIDPEYDYILTEGNYFVGVDMPEGEVMLYRLSAEPDSNDSINVYYENEDGKQTGYSKRLTSKYPRIKCDFKDGDEIRLFEGGPIGVKYLQD